MSGQAFFRIEHWQRARQLAEWARRTPCFCKEKLDRVIDCEPCTAVMIAHAMTEAETAEKRRGLA